MDELTRVFFVVDTHETNEEIFETLQEAREYASALSNPRIAIALVENAFKEKDGTWNYDDFSNTFEIIKEIK